jgi:hypothetical protein
MGRFVIAPHPASFAQFMVSVRLIQENFRNGECTPRCGGIFTPQSSAQNENAGEGRRP